MLISEAAPAWESFQGFHLDLALELRRALRLPPLRLQAIELSDFMASDPSHPERLDLTRVVHALAPPAVPAYLDPPR